MLKGWGIIKKNIRRITMGIKGILYCTRKREHKISMIDPGETAREVHALFVNIAALAEVDIDLDVDPALGNVPLNAESLHTILSNLVHNAIDACRFDGSGRRHRIVIRAFGKGPLVIFEISDDGPGIQEEWEKSMFTRAFSTKDRYGSGLGLLITKKLVDELGGQITFSSRQNTGTAFRITFPVKIE
jgi:signal transduction histidine kinase